MKTIIQTIGPLYGDDANGTVFGQPNGSVYTPPANILTLVEEDAAANKVINDYNGVVSTAKSILTGAVRATFAVTCQVEWASVFELATDSAFTTIVSSRRDNPPHGGNRINLMRFSSGYTVVNGTTYYGRVRIVEVNGGAEIMKSGTYTFTGAA